MKNGGVVIEVILTDRAAGAPGRFRILAGVGTEWQDGPVPESPEVQALVETLDQRLVGRVLRVVDLTEFRALKTRARPLTGLVCARVTGVRRLGKHVDIAFGDTHLIVSLGRYGWARLGSAAGDESAPAAEAGPAVLVEFTFDDGETHDDGETLALTDAGSWVSLALHVVGDPLEVAAIAKLGADPVDQAFTRADLDAVVVRRRKQLKALLQEQESLAGIGNAYSDEILHRARLSPTIHAAALDETARERLFAAVIATLREAVAERRGIPIDRLKAAKVAAMRVHGRAGQACPRCGDTIRERAYGSTTGSSCPTCQSEDTIF